MPSGSRGADGLAHEPRPERLGEHQLVILAGAGMDDLDMQPHRASSIAPSSLGVGSIADGIEIGTEILIFM